MTLSCFKVVHPLPGNLSAVVPETGSTDHLSQTAAQMSDASLPQAEGPNMFVRWSAEATRTCGEDIAQEIIDVSDQSPDLSPSYLLLEVKGIVMISPVILREL